MKNNKKGKAKIWSSDAIKKMRRYLKSPAQRLIFEIGLYTGERIGAIVRLKIADVYNTKGQPLSHITFAGNTRKSSKHGEAATRSVLIHPELREALTRYITPVDSIYLFPSSWNKKYQRNNHISCRAVDDYWKNIFAETGLEGYSTHSSRRWVINQLRKNGVALLTIAETMGMSIDIVRHYCDVDPEDCCRAIATLSV